MDGWVDLDWDWKVPHVKRLNETTKQNLEEVFWFTFTTMLLANFVKGSASVPFNLHWAFVCENNIIESVPIIQNVQTVLHSLRLVNSFNKLAVLCTAPPPAKFPPHSLNSLGWYCNVKSLLEYSCWFGPESSLFAPITSSMVLKCCMKSLIPLPFLWRSQRLSVALYCFENVYWCNTNRTGTERIQNGDKTDAECEQNRCRTGMGTRAEWKQNEFCQAFPVRFPFINRHKKSWSFSHQIF